MRTLMDPTPTPLAKPIPSWGIPAPRVVPSSLGSGPVRGGWDIVRGRSEAAEGERLTAAQRNTLAPFLAERYGVAPNAVADAIAGTRIYVGGPIAGNGFAAMVLGSDIYVRDTGVLARITSWEGRRLLAHELGHVVQRLQLSDSTARVFGGGELGRTRAQLARYLAAMIVEPKCLPGAVPKAALGWALDRISGDRTPAKFGNLVHDGHRLEIQAERVAQEFLRATS